MVNIFEVFLPQLLRYPNPTDPLNGEAAALLMREPAAYDTKVKGTFNSFHALYLFWNNIWFWFVLEHVAKHASKEAYDKTAEEADDAEDEMR